MESGEEDATLLQNTNQPGKMMQKFSYMIRSSLSTTSNSVQRGQKVIPINGIIFDLDGTLTIPTLNFKELRKTLGCPPPPVDILEFIRSKAEEEEKSRLFKMVEDFEDEGNKNMKLQPGVHKVLKFITENGLERAVLTRNRQPCVDIFLEKLGDPSQYGGPFSHLLTRDFMPSKPDPAPIHHICKEWGIKPHNAIMVGDHIHDVTCGSDAGAVTILLNNPRNGEIKKMADFNIDSLEDIISLLKGNSMIVQRENQPYVQEDTNKNN